MNALKIMPETILDDDGMHCSAHLVGCSHHCPGCHNPESHSPLVGAPLTEEYLQQIADEINDNSLLDGITLSGGDSVFSPGELLTLLKRLKHDAGLEVWCYTGYTLEQIEQDPIRVLLLNHIDVLVDGRFVQSLYDPQLPFRGNSSRRIIALHKARC